MGLWCERLKWPNTRSSISCCQDCGAVLGVPLQRGREGRMKGGRRAVAGLLVVPVALGRLWMPVGGRACPGTRTNSSSHHQHKAAGRRTGQKKPIYPVCVCVSAFALFCAGVCWKVGGRGVRKKSWIILTEKKVWELDLPAQFLWKETRRRCCKREEFLLYMHCPGNKLILYHNLNIVLDSTAWWRRLKSSYCEKSGFVAPEEAACNLINCLQWCHSVAMLHCG